MSAIGIEARRGETCAARLDAKHESPADATRIGSPKPSRCELKGPSLSALYASIEEEARTLYGCKAPVALAESFHISGKLGERSDPSATIFKSAIDDHLGFRLRIEGDLQHAIMAAAIMGVEAWPDFGPTL